LRSGDVQANSFDLYHVSHYEILRNNLLGMGDKNIRISLKE